MKYIEQEIDVYMSGTSFGQYLDENDFSVVDEQEGYLVLRNKV